MTLNRSLWAVLPIVMVASLIGWSAGAAVADDEAAGQNQATPSKSDAGAASGDGGGVLMGRAVFDGSVPPPRKLVIDKDPSHCQHAQGEVQDVVVGKDGALAGVVVEIQGIKTEGDWDWQHPKDGYVIRQKGCAFAPKSRSAPIS